MKLTHIDLRAFRSFQETTIELDAPRILIAGLNGTGKSSIREAIRWVLAGHCSGLDGKGAGAEILIPVGQTLGDAAVTIQGIGQVKRTYAEKGGGSFSVQGFTGTSQIQYQGLMNKLETTPAFLDAVLSTEVFLDLNHIEAKALVLSLLNVQIPVGDKALTLDELDVQYNQAFADRKQAKWALSKCVLPVKPAETKMPAIEAIEAQLAKLRTALGELRQAVGSVTGERTALSAEQGRLYAHIDTPAGENLSGKIDGLQAKLASLEAAVVPAKAEEPTKGDPKRLAFLTGHKAALSAHVPANGCVLDPKVACLTPSKQFHMAVQDIEKEMATLKASVPQVAHESAESPLTTLRRQIRNVELLQSERTVILKRAEEATERIQVIRKQLAELPDVAEQETAVSILQERISKGEQLLKDAREYWDTLGRYDHKCHEYQILKADVERLEALVETLGPKGVRVKALGDALGRFEAAVNPYVQPFGWTLSFTVEPWEVFANGRPVITYSESEQFRVGLALQLGIAMLSGLKFAVVDRIDMLDVANRGIVTKILLTSPLEQILILGTREVSQALPAIKGVTSYRLSKEKDLTVISERSTAA